MPKRKSSSDNGVGLMIIIVVLGVALIKAFDIQLTVSNFKLLGLAGISIFIGIFVFFGAQSKKNYDENYYKTPDPEPEPEQNNYSSTDYNQTNDRYNAPNPYDATEDNRYGNQSYGNYNNNSDESNRW